MDTGIEGVGEAVSGGLLARSVEPEAGEGHGDGEACLNCGALLAGEFCHRCGQKAHVHRSLSAFGHDLLHGVLHFEGKIWRTLPMLALHPGQLTRRYIQGERANFVSPLALFLFSVFLMFAAISLLGPPVDLDAGKSRSTAEEQAEDQREFEKEQAENEAKLKTLNAELASARAAGEQTTGIEERIKGVQLEMRLQREAYDFTTRMANAEAVRERNEAAAEGKAKTEAGVDANGSVDVDFQNAPPAIRSFEERYKKAKANPSLMLYKLQSNAYKFSWALIPISLPFVWLLFLHRRRYRRQYGAYDHIVFVTYSIAFMSLGFIALTVLRPLGVTGLIPGLAITLVPPVHMYRQLRGAYELSRFSAAWRTFVLLNFTFVTSGIFLALLLLLGVG